MTDEQIDKLIEELNYDADEHKAFVPSDKSYQRMRHGSVQAITQLRDENKRLTEIVGRLPKTADGVRVLPGDRVWHPQHVGKIGGLVIVGEDGTMPPEDDGWFSNANLQITDSFVSRSIEVQIDECYSTREAAEAARKGGDV
jgi:hypothetical protein